MINETKENSLSPATRKLPEIDPDPPVLFALRAIRRHIELILYIIVLTTGLVWAYLQFVPPRYTATALITLNTPRIEAISVRNVVGETIADTSTIQTYIDVLLSQSLAYKVVEDLGLEADPEFNAAINVEPSLWRKLFDRASSEPAAPSIGKVEEAKPSFWGDLFGKASELVAPSVGITGEAEPSLWRKLFGMAPSEPAAPSIEKIAEVTRTTVIQSVLDRLRVTNDGHSYTLRISFTSLDPQKAATIANGFADAFLTSQLEAKFEAMRRAAVWLTERLAMLRTEVQTSERIVEEYRQSSNLMDIGGGQTITAQQAAQLNSELVIARVNRAEAEARLQGVQRLKALGDIEGAPEVLSSPLIQRLRGEETDLVRRIGEFSQHYGERHPTMVALRSEARDLQAKMDAEINRVVLGLINEANVARVREATLAENLALLQRRLGDASKAELHLNALQREAEADRTIMAAFLQRLRETAGLDALQSPDARLVSKARVPVAPSSPVTFLILGFAFLWAAVVGVSLAILIEYFDRGFRTERQLEEATGLISLGFVPELRHRLKRRRTRALHRAMTAPNSSLLEAILSIRTGLRILFNGRLPRICMVTSALPGEGKTSFAVALGMAAARTGSRVVIVDADMRRPALAQMFGLRPQLGLRDVLTDAARLDEAILEVKDQSLSLLCTRSDASSPLNLLDGVAMHGLLHRLAADFDLVIVDTPPVNAVSDALALAGSVDFAVVLIRWKSTRIEAARNAVRQLLQADVPIAGAVLSRVNIRRYPLYGYQDRVYHYANKAYFKNRAAE